MRLLVLGLPLLLAACSNPPYPRGGVEELYPQAPRPMLSTISAGGRTLQIASMPGSGTAPLLFVHGSPGDWKAWAHYLAADELAAFNPRIAVDRPGYGGSGAGKVMPDLRAQAAVLAALVPDGSKAVVVGHSLGGPLVGWLLIDHPEKFCGGVMIAGSIAPDLEAPRWYNYAAKSWLGRQLAPAEMLWSNLEIMALQGEARRLDAEWPHLQRPLVMLQGMGDELVDPRTADYAEQRIPKPWLTLRRIPKQGHFLLWDEPQLVIDAIESLPCKP